MSGRGSRSRLGAVSIKVERIVHNQDRQENGGVYEDEVVYVTERPRKRGRPRKPANVVTAVTPRPTPQPLLQRYPRSVNSNEVILVTRRGRGRQQYVIPPRNSIAHQPLQHPVVHTPRPFTMCPVRCTRPLTLLSSVTSTGQMVTNVKPVPGLEVPKVCDEKNKRYLSNDLQELVDSWDSLPETRTREVVKWLQAPSCKSPQPKIVREIQEMWGLMTESWEEKVDLALEWLQEGEHRKSFPLTSYNLSVPFTVIAPLTKNVVPPSNKVTLPSNGVSLPSNSVASVSSSAVSPMRSVALLSLSRAKVLVEAQPTPLQDSSQWSSMVENSDKTNH